MANRRMMSKSVVHSSAFLMMPLSSQALYMHLNISADDDGYCEYFGIMRLCGAQQDDLKILAAKDFVQVFDDKVLIMRDWKENNYIQKDRYTPSKYLEVYRVDTPCIQNVSNMDTQYRIGEDREVKDTNTIADENAVNEMKQLWKDHAGTTLRNHVPENLKAYKYLLKEVDNLHEYLQAVRMIRADQYQKRTLQGKLINYVGLRDKLDEVEAYMQSQVDRHHTTKVLEIP